MRYIITGTYQNGDNYAEEADTIEQLTETLRQLTGWADADGRYEVGDIRVETEEA